MAQNIILKRSALPGKVPDTGSLNLGEIAINTYDGKAFIHKSGSTESIEQIVVTNSITTGSIIITQTGSFGEIDVTNDINVSGSIYVTTDIVANGDLDILGAVSASIVSASVFYGDGSQLTGISAGVTDSEIPTNDWDYNLPDSGTLSDGNNQSTKYTIDFQAEAYGTRPVGYQAFISNTDGGTEIIPGTDSIVFIVNDLEVGRIDENGITANAPLGTISSSAQITALGYVTSSLSLPIYVGDSTIDVLNEKVFLGSSGGDGIQMLTDGGSLIYDNEGVLNLPAIIRSGYDASSWLNAGGGLRIKSGTAIWKFYESSPGYSAIEFPDTTYQYTAFPGFPSNLISSSQQITDFGFVSESVVIPSGTISGSSQLTSSFETTGRGIISGAVQLTTVATTGSNTFTGLQTFQQIQEVISLKPSLGLGTNNFDFNSGSIFYIAGLTGSGTWNVQNIPSASNAATSLTFVIQQGGTAYSASAYQLGGTAVSVKWLDGTIPTGSANATDVIGLTAFRSGSSWNVIGSLSKFS